ncbi:hypothetical protein [Pasteurella multocida]|uniref:hypothetical protein n=1 Tax=Pasteurella multocida TaxID=747 RepID=UPI00147BF2E2|nr:hypothetical protein [Pasteurella multocida]NNH97778.1 hypothetical protein [Pasteurella multocida]
MALINDYLEKIRLVMASIENDLGVHFSEEVWKFGEKVSYQSLILGVKVEVIFTLERKSEVSLHIGEYRRDFGRTIYKKIGLSFKRTKEAIKREVMKRLGLKNVMEYVKNISDFRKEKEAIKEKDECIDNIFKHYLPFRKSYLDGLFARYGSTSFDVDISRKKITICGNDVDFVIQIVAYAKKLIDEKNA